MLQQRRLLRSQLEQARSVDAHNRIVSAMNELGDRIVLMEKEAEGDEKTRTVRAKANEARESYAEGLLKLRKAYDALGEKYADMAANPQVKEAISKYSEAAGPMQLGPTPAYVSLGNNLRKLEETVLSEAIDLRRGDGKLFYVSVVFDGKYTKEMALDTGSSLISLPYELANDVGLTPDETAQDIVLTLADGRQVPAKLMKAKSVRVGKFMAEDIECAVLPKELTEAEPLLGLAFLDHFSYKIDTERAKLIMTRVETAPAKPMR
jgi:aspartyl protease family protein